MGDKSVIRRLFLEIKVFYASFIFALLLYWPTTLLALLQPYMIGKAVEEVFQVKDLGLVTWWSLLFFLVVLSHAFFEMLQQYAMRKVGLQLIKELRAKLFAKIQRLPMAYFDQTPLGRILTCITNDVESLSELFSSGSMAILGDLCFLFGTILMLFLIDVELTLASLAILPVLAFGLVFMRKWMRIAFSNARFALSKINIFIQEYLSGMQTVQLFSQVSSARLWFDEVNDEYMKANRKVVFLDAAIYSFVDAVSTITIAVILWVGMGFHEQGLLPLGVMIIFIEALTRFFSPIRELANKYAIFQNALVSAQRIFLLLDFKEDALIFKTTSLAHFKKTISFANVSFAYHDKTLVLSNINFEIVKGEKIALVGHTGAGKSTVTKLLTRFYEVSQGQILFDGVDIRGFDLVSFRGLFNVVPQEVFLFAGTLRDNLKYGRESANDDEVLEALRLCQALYLMERQDGLDAKVETHGHNFSFGERQLLSLTRALIADPQILILDEATAGVDVQTEKKLRHAIHEVVKNRTAIVVAHRLSTIKDCDRILVFSKGEIDEQGTHSQLIKQQGLYAKLIELQKQEKSIQAFTA